jgi:RNA polymerase sigma-70 factor (ECF subfamily)
MLATLWFTSDLGGNESAPAARREHAARARREDQEAKRDQIWVASLAGSDLVAADHAMSAVVSAYFDRLIRFAYGFVGSGDVAEDIVQETLLRVWETRTTLRADRSFRAYLFTAVRHRALNLLKHAAVEERHAAHTTEPEPIVLGVDDELDAARIEQAIRAVIATLPERRRTVIRLRYEEELPFQTVAEIMGISEKAAKDLTARTVREIRLRIRFE